MSQPLTEAALDAIARNPNVTAAIARLATCYAESMHLTTRTNATIRAEDEVLSRVGKAVWFCVHDATTGGARGEAPKAAPVTPRRTDQMTVEEMAAGLGYTRNSGGYWVKDGTSMVMGWPSGRWTSWIGSDDTTVKEHPTEHAALARLYAHQFPEPTTPPTPAPPPPAPAPPAREAPPQAPRSVHDIAAAIASATARMSVGEAKVREGERLIAEARAALVTLHAELGAALAAPG